MRTETKKLLSKITPATAGMCFAWLAVMIYATSNSIATLLVDIGMANPLSNGRSAITFTNLLFVGSLISLIPISVLFRGDLTRANMRRLSRHEWALLTVSACFSSALTPGLLFYALEHSSVTNVMLVGRIEPPLFVVAAAVFLKERIDIRSFKAGLIALCGAMLIIGQRDSGSQATFGFGEIVAVFATLSYVVSAILARRALKCIPMGVYSVYRTAVGTVIYAVLILTLRGPQEFQGLFSPVLWQWIWIYVLIVLVIGQLVGFLALKYARSGDISLAASFSPLAVIVFAMLLLGEDPGLGLLPGTALILLAVFVGKVNTPILQQVQSIWRERPTYTSGDIAKVVMPVAAFYSAPRLSYNGSY